MLLSVSVYSVYLQVEECHLPGLGVALTLDYKPDTADEAVSPLVSYVSGLLLGTNSKVRTWFSMFIHNGQQVRGDFKLFTKVIQFPQLYTIWLLK